MQQRQPSDRMAITLSAVPLTIIAMLVTVLAASGFSTNAGAQVMTFTAAINGTPLTSATSSSPIVIEADREMLVDLDVTNPTSEELTLGFVRLEGSAVGIRFLSYDTAIFAPIEPGESRSMRLPVEFLDLEQQADGYVRTDITLFDVQRRQLANDSFVADVIGSSTSSLRMFAIGSLFFAVITVGLAVYLTLRRRLHKNRMVRGFQFAYSGLAIGLLISLFLPIFRIVALAPAAWFFALAVPAMIGFVIGYLTPQWLSQWAEWEDSRDERFVELQLQQAAQANS